MADRTKGPVKPPVLDLEARPASAVERVAGAASPEALAGDEPVGPKPARRGRQPSSDPTRPDLAGEAGSQRAQPPPPDAAGERGRAATGLPWAALGAAALAGALAGTVLTYIAATFFPLPSNAPVIADPAPRLAAQAERLDLNEQRLAAIEERAVDMQLSLDATLTQLDSGLAELRGLIGDVRDAIPEPVEPVDTAAISERLRTLSARVDAIAAGASSADAGAMAENLADLEAMLASLAARVDALGVPAGGADEAIAALRADLDQLRETLVAAPDAEAPRPAPPSPSLVLATSRLGAAFASGRPYAVELEALAAVTAAEIPPAVAQAASTGLPAPELLAERFAAVVPDMLAARSPADGAGWQDTTAEWLKGLLALRPAGEVEGDTPEAVMSRLEAAIERRDFVAAAPLFGLLPEGMRRAAGEVPQDVGLLAEAGSWLARLSAEGEVAR